MTEKKELILQTALKLFSEKGFENTPTSLVAKEANVSEGLIFRHFGSKDGLLDAILTVGETRVLPFVESIVAMKNPQKIIAQIIDFPTVLIQAEPAFWLLQTRLKWHQKQRSNYKQPVYYTQLFAKCVEAFTQLGYTQPEQEALLLFYTIEGLGQSIMLQTVDNQRNIMSADITEGVIHLLKSKYLN